MTAMAKRSFEGLPQLHVLESRLPAWADHKASLVASLLEGTRVLDVGCGVGTFSRRLLDRGFTVTGLDPDPSCVASAKKLAPGAEFLVGDAASSPPASRARSIPPFCWTCSSTSPRPWSSCAACARRSSLGGFGGDGARLPSALLKTRCGRRPL